MISLEKEKKIERILKEFDSLPEIVPSEEWNHSLMKKINTEKNISSKSSSGFKIFFIFVTLLNIGLAVKSIMNIYNEKLGSSNELKIISKELFIIPNSVY